MRCSVASLRSAALIALLALLAALAACAPAAGSPPPPSAAPAAAAASSPGGGAASPAAPAAPPRASFTTSMLPPAAFQWPSYVAQDKGFLAAEGIDPDVVQVGTPNEAARVVVSGTVALANFSVDAAVRAVEGGGDLVVVGSEIANPAFSLIVQPELRDYADMRGKSIAVSTPKDGAAVVLRLMLRARGLADDEYDFASVGTTPNRYAALTSRAADGAIMTQPLDFVAIDAGYRLLGRSSDVLKEFMFMSISANRTWAREQRPLLVRYMRAMGNAVDWLYDPANKEEAIDLLAARTNTERSAVTRTYAVMIEEGRVIPRRAEVPLGGLEVMLRSMIELGDLPGPTANPNRYIDLSIVQDAQQ